MIPVEPISLSISAIALASLFSECIQCFEYFQAGQSLEDDFQILLTKLDFEKERLLIWGSAVGILKAQHEGRIPLLEEPSRANVIESGLECISRLLTRASELQDQYGVVSTTATDVRAIEDKDRLTSNSMSTFKASYKRFWARFAGTHGQAGLRQRTKWAIHDKSRFEGLVIHLRDFIDDLNEMLPISREVQDRMIEDDMASILNISGLRLIQSACEGTYQQWSEVASGIIQASEIGTLDRRNVEERLKDTEGVADSYATLQKSSNVISPTDSIYYDALRKWFFVLTGRCLQSNNSLCSPADFGASCFGAESRSHIAVGQSYWSIGRRITDRTPLSSFTKVDLDKATQQDRRLYNQPYFKAATVYLYCAPCVCLLHTAFQFWKGEGISSYLRYVIRVDERLESSCCNSSSKLDRMASLVNEINKIESTGTLHFRDKLQYIDRPYLEHRLYEMEEELYEQNFLSSISKPVTSILREVDSNKCAGVVFLGEADYFSKVMSSAMFVPRSRMPIETQVFEAVEGPMINDVQLWDRKFMGTYTPRIYQPYVTSTQSVPPLPSGQKSLYTPSIARQTSPPLTPSSKRRKTTSSIGEESE